MGLLHRADKAVICGDAVMHLFGRLSKPFPFVTPDLKTARQSIVRLSERDFHHLLPSHGPPILAKGRQSLIRYVRKSTRKLFEGAG
jgi:glyoxylase-like metal-dependent hydrolase (beta-lactamase superfamily II)